MGDRMRVGVYNSRIAKVQSEYFLEHIRRRCSQVEFEPVEIEAVRKTYDDEYEQIMAALQKDEIDVALIDGTKLIKGELKQSGRSRIRVVGAGKRSNPVNVLVRNKKGDKSKSEVRVAANEPIYQKQMELINEGVVCDYIHSGVSKSLRMVINQEYDGAVVPASKIRYMHLHRQKCLQYTEYDRESFIPLYGQGIVAAIMMGNAKPDETLDEIRYEQIVRKASHTDSLREFAIEQEVISKINIRINTFLQKNCSYTITPEYICVNAWIDGDKLQIGVFINMYGDEWMRTVVRGSTAEKNRLIWQLIERIEKKLID